MFEQSEWNKEAAEGVKTLIRTERLKKQKRRIMEGEQMLNYRCVLLEVYESSVPFVQMRVNSLKMVLNLQKQKCVNN